MKAIILGATGLIGRELLTLLLDTVECTEVHVVHRRSSSLQHPKLHWHTVDLNDSSQWTSLITADVLFNAMGTTIKKAGSEKAMIKVDVSIPNEVAKIAKSNGVKTMISVSAAGANAKSKIFYNKIKGQLEEHLRSLAFDHTCILRPSLLTGDRQESRLGEKIMEPIMQFLAFIPFLKKYRPIEGKDVAKAMVKYALTPENSLFILELDEIQDYVAALN